VALALERRLMSCDIIYMLPPEGCTIRRQHRYALTAYSLIPIFIFRSQVSAALMP
jgi:hypothetical protein